MPSSSQVRFVDRVQFFNGQRLIAGDLQALEEYEREMRWLHNRSLHQPGVASGLAVRGDKGDPFLVIEPGYAIDALGREIILGEVRTEPVPPVASDEAGNPAQFDLTVSYSAALPASETRRSVCENAAGAVRLEEVPVFCWVRVGSPDAEALRLEIERGERILLAHVEVLNCQLYQRVSIAQRRNAKPALHPFVFAEVADVTWTMDEDPANPYPFGIRLCSSVDTRAAGFRTSPSYFVSLLGAQSVDIVDNGQSRTVPIDGFVEVSDVTPESFQVAVLIPSMLFYGSDIDVELVREALRDLIDPGNSDKGLSWRVEWLGVEG